jgi:SAM-dependent methyltransferase
MESEEYQYLFELEDRLWWFVGMREITEALFQRFVPRRRPLLILDAGCGTGGMLTHLRRYGTVFGVDYSEDAVRWVRRRDERALARGSIEALPFGEASFDLITEFEVLNHWSIADDRVAFRELARTLRPGGLLFLREPAHRWLFAKHDLAVHSRQRYGRKELEQKITQAGLEPLYLGYANCLLFPVALVRRLAGNLFPGNHGSDVREIPPPLNRLLTAVLRLEARVIRTGRLPIGLSLLGVARKAA